MEQYKKALSIRIRICGVILLFLGALLIVGSTWGVRPLYNNVHLANFYRGMLFGATCTGIAFAIVFIIKTVHCLRHEETLRKEYVKEHDERACLIWQKAGYMGWRISSIIMLLGALAAGYWNLTVSLTLLAAAAGTSLLIKIVCMVYSKTM